MKIYLQIPEIIKVEDRPTKSHHSETSVKKLKVFYCLNTKCIKIFFGLCNF